MHRSRTVRATGVTRNEINHLTDELLHWERNIGQLRARRNALIPPPHPPIDPYPRLSYDVVIVRDVS
jgi:hypothetical protein